MTVLTHELRASYAFVERNFFLTRRYWGWEIAFLVYSVAGALSVSLIGAAVGDTRLLLSLVIGAIFWNYLSVIFSWIAETIAVERWEGTLEYTMMAPVRRYTHLVGAAMYGLAREGGSYGAASKGKSLALGGVVGAILAGLAPTAVNLLFQAARA